MKLSAALFHTLMQPFTAARRIGVAVSGGPDSMALAIRLAEWAKANSAHLHAFTVDHALREHSAAEARQVGAWLAPLGIPHHILEWAHGDIHSGIHAEARRARYDLLLDACHMERITHLFLAHHADDQAETVLMRFVRGSGPDGLAGMPLMREASGVFLCRPLLPVRKSKLVEACEANSWPFVTDPSNSAPRFARAQIRDAQDGLAKQGMTIERLYDMARLNGIQRAHMEEQANQWLNRHGTADAYGAVTLDATAWAAESEAMRCRLLVRGLLCVGNGEYAPRGSALDRLGDMLLRQPKDFPGKTLSGCTVTRDEHHILFAREEAAVDETYPVSRWDKRFTLKGGLPPGGVVKKLGQVSRDKLEKKGFYDIAALPARIRCSLPAVFHNQQCIDMPVFTRDAERTGLIHAQFSPYRSLIAKAFYPCPPFVD